MKILNLVKKETFYDSVTLMLVSKKLKEEKGIIDASVMMGTEENLKILKSAGLLQDNIKVSPNDIIIAIKGEEKAVNTLASQIDKYFNQIYNAPKEKKAKNLDEALKLLPDANLALISIPGEYVYNVAIEALNRNLNLKIFSDNVPIEDEIKLKKIGIEKKLFVLGPDAGTSIINGIPLGFANAIRKGNIGIIGAAGTGIQETSVIISKNGAGVSCALGIGSRDLTEKVGGIMAKFALQTLDNNEDTKIILFVAKFSERKILKNILNFIEENIKKEVVTIFLGADKDFYKGFKVIPAINLYDAAIKATKLSKNEKIKDIVNEKQKEIKDRFKNLKRKNKYIRALFSGGTLCEEAIITASPVLKKIYSNVPLRPEFKIDALVESKEHTFIDMGSDEFTKGRPHPMIDYETRARRIIQEAKDKNVGVILADIVLGFNANPDPASEIIPAIIKAKEINPELLFVIYILGTNEDIQNFDYQMKEFQKVGAIIANSNFEATLIATEIVS